MDTLPSSLLPKIIFYRLHVVTNRSTIYRENQNIWICFGRFLISHSCVLKIRASLVVVIYTLNTYRRFSKAWRLHMQTHGIVTLLAIRDLEDITILRNGCNYLPIDTV